MNAIIAMAMKDIRLLLRDKAGFFFTFFFPIIVAVFFGAIFSGNSGSGSSSMGILVVDEDQSAESREFVGHLETADEVRIERVTRADAMERVRLGAAVAYVAVPEGFGEARKNLFWGSPPEVEIGVDPSQKATAGMLHGILMKYGVLGFQKAFSDPAVMRDRIASALPEVEQSPDMDPALKTHFRSFLTELDGFMGYLDQADRSSSGEQPTESNTDTATTPVIGANASPAIDAGDNEDGFSGFQPLVIRNTDIVRERKGPSSGYAVSFPQGIMWGIIGCSAAFGISLVVERSRGTLIRLLSAPVSLMQILAGKALACFLTTLAISSGLVLLAAGVFHVEPSSYLLLAMAIVSICTGFVGIMMLLAVLGKTEQAAGGIGWAFLLIMSMLGGGMIPLFIMPNWMQSLSHISPVKWSMLAMEGAIWRQFTFVEMLRPCGIIIGVGLACFTIGVRVFRRTVQD